MTLKQILGWIEAKTFVKYSKHFSRQGLYNNIEIALKKHYKKGMTVISIGAGGDIKRDLIKKNIDFKEVDIDPESNPDYVANVEDLSIFKNNSIDLILCFEVLEHVQNPSKALNEFERILTPKGVIIGSTPFIFPIHDEPHDYYRYTKYGLQYLFRNFEKITIKERNSYFDSLYVLSLRIYNVGSVFERMIYMLFFPFLIILSLFIKFFNLLFNLKSATTGYFFIFKKKQLKRGAKKNVK